MQLVAQGFSQKPGVDYKETLSPVMDAITYNFLISLVVSERLDMRLMNVITVYLYRSMDNDIYDLIQFIKCINALIVMRYSAFGPNSSLLFYLR